MDAIELPSEHYNIRPSCNWCLGHGKWIEKNRDTKVLRENPAIVNYKGFLNLSTGQEQRLWYVQNYGEFIQ